MLEESSEKPNVFKASIGNLPPGKEVLISLTYVTELEFDEGKLKFFLPALVKNFDLFSSILTLIWLLFSQPYPEVRAPNYFRASKFTTYAKDVAFGMKIDIQFNMTSGIKSISSPSHPISVWKIR